MVRKRIENCMVEKKIIEFLFLFFLNQKYFLKAKKNEGSPFAKRART
jgi:hypothetical protein